MHIIFIILFKFYCLIANLTAQLQRNNCVDTLCMRNAMPAQRNIPSSMAATRLLQYGQSISRTHTHNVECTIQMRFDDSVQKLKL